MPEIYQIDAFTDELFGGNPATPSAEVALCGHATLAAAHVAFNHLQVGKPTISFQTRESGILQVSRIESNRLSMSFPAIMVSPVDAMDSVGTALGKKPSSLWKGHYSKNEYDYMAVYDSASDVASLSPDYSRVAQLGSRGVIATAAAENCDFVSRYFAPAVGISEDPVTGSAHCLLTPFWADRLSANVLHARQISTRGGVLECRHSSDRVELIGQAVDYMKGVIFTDPTREIEAGVESAYRTPALIS